MSGAVGALVVKDLEGPPFRGRGVVPGGDPRLDRGGGAVALWRLGDPPGARREGLQPLRCGLEFAVLELVGGPLVLAVVWRGRVSSDSRRRGGGPPRLFFS